MRYYYYLIESILKAIYTTILQYKLKNYLKLGKQEKKIFCCKYSTKVLSRLTHYNKCNNYYAIDKSCIDPTANMSYIVFKDK